MLPGTGRLLRNTALAVKKKRTQALICTFQQRFAGGPPKPGRQIPDDMHEYWTLPYIWSRIAGEKSEGWEAITLALYIGTAMTLTLVAMGPNTSITDWAKDEALARDIREYKGLPLEYGKFYHQVQEDDQDKVTDLSDDDDDDDDDA